MTPSEETYAAWMNVLGSGTVNPVAVNYELRVMRVVATATGDSERMATAYLDVLLALAPEVGAVRAKELTQALVDAAQAHRVRYVSGTPLMIDGTDCSPDAVRSLKKDRDHYRRAYLSADVTA